MEELKKVAKIGVMISNAWPDSRTVEGATARAIAETLERYPYLDAIQTVDVPFAKERREIARHVRGTGRSHTYMLTRRLNAPGISLSSLDLAARAKAVAIVKECLADAVEAGASQIGLVSGARPALEGERAAALRALESSLEEVVAAAKEHGLDVMIEPLDYEADKRATLGSTAEAVAICDNLAAKGLKLLLCLDTAHLLLNGEDIPAAVKAASRYVAEFHVCNAVTDRAHPLFGDRHLPFGEPGRMNEQTIGELLAALVTQGFLREQRRPRLMCEVMKPANMESHEVVRHGLETLERAYSSA